ncbi:hypothetical protein VTN96DRAFT_1570 [Rasamsonia emersonii]
MTSTAYRLLASRTSARAQAQGPGTKWERRPSRLTADKGRAPDSARRAGAEGCWQHAYQGRYAVRKQKGKSGRATIAHSSPHVRVIRRMTRSAAPTTGPLVTAEAPR